MSIIAFEPHRFETAAQHYVRGRLSYPKDLTQQVAALVGLTRHDRVLDLGCGPGFLAAAFAPIAKEVLGIDPEPAMLEVAEQYTRERGVAVHLQRGSSYDLNPSLGRFQLVTMGRSFHWMDRKDTLERLDLLVEPNGALALFADNHVDVAANRWKKRFMAVLEPTAKKDPAYIARKGPDANWTKHEEFLLASPFRKLRRISVIQELDTPVDRLVDRALSQSITSPQRLGDERESLLATLRRELEQGARDGLVHEVVEFEALIAFRP